MIREEKKLLRKESTYPAGMRLTEAEAGDEESYSLPSGSWGISGIISPTGSLGFVSYGSEICTTEILENALQDGKEVYVPKVEGREMRFYRIRSLTELKEGYKGIREPQGNTESYVFTPENAAGSLFLMPGSVFDPLGNRLGYGGGFYDRYLADKEALRLRSIAVGFRCQQAKEVPVEETDIKPYQVILV